MKPSVMLLLLSLAAQACGDTPCERDPECIALEPCAGGHCDGSLAEPVETLGCRTPSAGELRLNEVLADPSGSDINADGIPDPFDDEFVELLSMADVPINLEGVTLKVNGKVRTVLRPRCLEAGRSLVIYGGGEVGGDAVGAIVADGSLKLTNSGATVGLFDLGGEVLDQVTYSDEADGPQSVARLPDGTGDWGIHAGKEGVESPVRHSAGRCNTGGLFPQCEAMEPATDGEDAPVAIADCLTVEPGELLVNEVLADPGGHDANGDGNISWREDEFVEFVLIARSARNLTGVTLTVSGAVKALFPPGCHEPKTAFVVFGGGTVSTELGEDVVAWSAGKQLGLSNKGATVGAVLNAT
ncbi:MAG: hypothetical protein ACI9OJ_003545, partial [Myxococcota bacterium]